MNDNQKLISKCFGGERANFAESATDRESALNYLKSCMERGLDWHQAQEEIEVYLDPICNSEHALIWKHKQIAIAQNFLSPWLDIDNIGDNIPLI